MLNNQRKDVKDMCQFSDETQKKAKSLRIIDDSLFRLVAKRRGACQEILRTLLDDEQLEVITVTPQATVASMDRGVVLDALCKLADGTICNIEMQKADKDNDLKRVRFHAAIITTTNTPKGTPFNDIPTVKVLYITEYDALGNGQVVTHVSRCQKLANQYIPVDDGEDFVFANTVVKDDSSHTKLLQLLLKRESFHDEDFPELSEAMHHFKETEKGVSEVCETIEKYANDKALDAAINMGLKFNQRKDVIIKAVMEEFPQMSQETIVARLTYLREQKHL